MGLDFPKTRPDSHLCGHALSHGGNRGDVQLLLDHAGHAGGLVPGAERDLYVLCSDAGGQSTVALGSTANQVEINQIVRNSNYTDRLWRAIQATKRINWIKAMNPAPRTRTWDIWLKKAKENCENPDWDATGERDRMMAQAANQWGQPGYDAEKKEQEEQQGQEQGGKGKRRSIYPWSGEDQLYCRVVVLLYSTGEALIYSLQLQQ